MSEVRKMAGVCGLNTQERTQFCWVKERESRVVVGASEIELTPDAAIEFADQIRNLANRVKGRAPQ